jgi:hypothetical protein
MLCSLPFYSQAAILQLKEDTIHRLCMLRLRSFPIHQEGCGSVNGHKRQTKHEFLIPYNMTLQAIEQAPYPPSVTHVITIITFCGP